MADITASAINPGAPGASVREGAAPALDAARQARLVAMVELLFFAYRDFTAEPDAILAEIGFGRAHHRVLHFVGRNAGLRVADLLGILKITKQSLARVLKQLIDEGYVVQTAGPSDRRERRLHVTDKGRALAERLLALQTQRIAAALAACSSDAEAGAAAFLREMISAADREAVVGPARVATTHDPATHAGSGFQGAPARRRSGSRSSGEHA